MGFKLMRAGAVFRERRHPALYTRRADSRADLEDWTQMMDAATIRLLVEQQLNNSDWFVNMHGVTASNLRSQLVDPFEATVDPDGLETSPRSMWVVLQERASPYDGYVVVYDPATADWGVAELSEDDPKENVLVAAASTLQGALDGM